MYYYEKGSGRIAKELFSHFYYGTDKRLILLEFQDTKETFIISDKHLKAYFLKGNSQLTTDDKLTIYRELFKGRTDVYAKSFVNQDGKIQYYPSYQYGWRNLPPDKRKTDSLTNDVLIKHFRGDDSVGIFPITLKDTCYFLAVDFDKKDWKEAVAVFRKVARQRGIEAYVEISRSGDGAHVWFFFETEVSCQTARRFGKKLLELTMQESKSISFSSFDRMFPNQYFLPKGGFGNLIALPLQGKSYVNGCTVFVDDSFKPYSDQWQYLKNAKKVTIEQINSILNLSFSDDFSEKTLQVELSNEIKIKKSSISAKTAHYLKKLASFSNPEFYKKQAMRQPTYNIPERIYLFREDDESLFLPRGLITKLNEQFSDLSIVNKQYSHSDIRVSFHGKLRFEQEVALSDLTRLDNGILCAGTGFGKTVLGAALISKHQKKTIILVHNRQLMEQWLERVSTFLEVDEESAVRYTPSGRKKEIGCIGQYGASKKWRSKIIDVVMIQSLFKLENIEDFLKDYDMMIVDECHHVTALQFERVVAKFGGRYLYGLTATPERKNGHEPILFQRIGEINHTAEDLQLNLEKELYLRLTSFGKLSQEKIHSSNFNELSEWLIKDTTRNKMICTDICDAFKNNRKSLVLVNRVEHIGILGQYLKQNGVEDVFLLSGSTKRKHSKKAIEEIIKLDNKPFVLISTAKFVGEGFDLPKLDTLFLTTPISWKNNVIQYVGRIHRTYERKSTVKVYDYLDIHIPYLERMYQRRQVAYRKMKYKVKMEKEQSLYQVDNYEKSFRDDLANSSSEIVIRASKLSYDRIIEFLLYFNDKNVIIQYSKFNRAIDWLKRIENKKLQLIFVNEKIKSDLVVIDSSIVWYGEIPIFGKQYNCDNSLLRLESPEIAKEFLTNHFYENNKK